MMRKIMIFETSVGNGGHHLEYLNHLYLRATKITDKSFVFVVPEQFKITSNSFEWPKASNISFDYIVDNRVCRLRKFSRLKYCFTISRLAKFYFEKHNANEIFLISFIHYIMFLPFMISKKAIISGILYYVYLYDWEKLDWKKRIEQILVFLVMTKRKNIGRLYVLNDSSAVAYLNKLYKTDKFAYIPDPVAFSDLSNVSIKSQLKIPSDSKAFLQCGMMSKRKMTLKILDTIEALSNDKNLYFLFTGRIQNDIKDEFYHKYELIKEYHNIYVKDNHLSYGEMSQYLDSCDYVFILYSNVAQSSGFLGHAALHRKPVIAYRRGMIGKLVRKYHLGYTITDDSPVPLSHSIQEYAKTTYFVGDKYIKTHQVKDFTKQFFE